MLRVRRSVLLSDSVVGWSPWPAARCSVPAAWRSLARACARAVAHSQRSPVTATQIEYGRSRAGETPPYFKFPYTPQCLNRYNTSTAQSKVSKAPKTKPPPALARVSVRPGQTETRWSCVAGVRGAEGAVDGRSMGRSTLGGTASAGAASRIVYRA
jgi:hypothetical protein